MLLLVSTSHLGNHIIWALLLTTWKEVDLLMFIRMVDEFSHLFIILQSILYVLLLELVSFKRNKMHFSKSLPECTALRNWDSMEMDKKRKKSNGNLDFFLCLCKNIMRSYYMQHLLGGCIKPHIMSVGAAGTLCSVLCYCSRQK